MTLPFLNPDKAYIFPNHTSRQSSLDPGTRTSCEKWSRNQPEFPQNGDYDLIDKPRSCHVQVGQGGTLSNYIPFYFTPLSIMAYNIRTGHRGSEHLPDADLLILFPPSIGS